MILRNEENQSTILKNNDLTLFLMSTFILFYDQKLIIFFNKIKHEIEFKKVDENQ